MRSKSPQALFDTMEGIEINPDPEGLSDDQTKDYQQALGFLRCYIGSKGTFNSYRREVERLLQYCWYIAGTTLPQVKRVNIEEFISFSISPPKAWIGLSKPPRFINTEGVRVPNPKWRPYVVTVSKSARKRGKKLKKEKYAISEGSIKEMLAILSSFFNFMLQEEYLLSNPIALLRQKSKYYSKRQGPAKILRLSNKQWGTVMDVAYELAEDDPDKHERTLFILSVIYLMYLRISEVCVSDRWAPSMNHFSRDHDGLWWFNTVGKGNKARDIPVSDDMLKALKRWRKHLGLTALPSQTDDSPLIPKLRGKGGISDPSNVRDIVQNCFDLAEKKLRDSGLTVEADLLMDATVHWLRHTAISEDVKTRPREHVRDDAGHGSSATTDGYIDVELKERHRSAKKKKIV